MHPLKKPSDCQNGYSYVMLDGSSPVENTSNFRARINYRNKHKEQRKAVVSPVEKSFGENDYCVELCGVDFNHCGCSFGG